LARVIAATDVRGEERIPPMGGRVEVALKSGERYGGELLPDPSTYGWDWSGVLANIERMAPEMAVSAAQRAALVAVVRDVTKLETVTPIVSETIPVAG